MPLRRVGPRVRDRVAKFQLKLTNPKLVKIMLQVTGTQIVLRFLLERDLRFRYLQSWCLRTS